MRKIISLIGIVLLLMGTVLAQDKPNILWITIEDTSPQFIGCYGNSNARTPVIDELAEQGVRFTNAFSTGTVCSPSRSAIITGVKTYKLGTGNHRSSYQIPQSIKGFPYYLKNEGYYTTNNSKTDYNIANAKKFIKEAWNENSGKSGWWNRKPGQPFFAVFNFMDSHQSRTMTNSYDWYENKVLSKLSDEERIGDNDFDMPPFYKDSPDMRKQMSRVYNSLKLTDNKIGKLLQKLEDDKLRDSTIIFFYADHGEGIPRGKTNGINLGYRVPFVVWFPEMYKHLSPWGKSGVVTDELVCFEDLAPTLIRLAGGELPKHLEGRVLIGKEREKPKEYLVLSADRADNGIDMVRTVTNGDFVYSRNYYPYQPEVRYIRYMEIGKIKKQMRRDYGNGELNDLQSSIFEARPAEFLFNIKDDKWETNNLVKDSKYKSVLNKMRKLLDKEVLNARDVMFLPEYEIAKISENEALYDFRFDKKRYSLKEIYNAASLSGFRSDEVAKKQVGLFKSSNQIVRYWAIMGMRSQNADIIQNYKKEISLLMDDEYEPVSASAAVIMYQFFKDSKAEKLVHNFMKSSNDQVAMQTINMMCYCQDKEPFEDVAKVVQNDKDRNKNVRGACEDFLRYLE